MVSISDILIVYIRKESMKQKEIELLFRQHYAKLLQTARTLIYDEDEARDVVSEVFASLLRFPAEPDNAEAYLTTSVRNRCLNSLKRKDTTDKFRMAYANELLTAEQDGSEQEQADYRLDCVMDFMEKEMKPQTRRAFTLRHLGGLKYKEIADEMGISRVMVYKHLAQAMEQINGFIRQLK